MIGAFASRGLKPNRQPCRRFPLHAQPSCDVRAMTATTIHGGDHGSETEAPRIRDEPRGLEDMQSWAQVPRLRSVPGLQSRLAPVA